jgi:hypothetical protein
MFQDKSLLAVAEAVKKVWAEELIGNQTKIDKNHNGKIDAQDFKILKSEKKKTVKEEAKKPVSPFDWKNTPKQTGEKGELSGHTSKKISTGTVYTKKYTKEEASQEEFTAELKKAQAKAQGKEKADVAKPAVQAVQNEQTHTQVEVFDLNDANGVKRSVIDLEEAKSGYDLYHSMYSGAVQHGLAHHEKSGLTVDPDDYHDKVTVGPKKPSEGKTVSHNIKATNAKGESHMIHMQVHNKGGNKPYELNTYSSKVPKKQVKEEVTGLHPDAQKVLKHIKPEHQSKYHADLTPKTYKGDYADRSAILGAAERAGHLKEEVEQIDERHLTSAESEKMEKNVKSMKKGLAGFKERYGKDAKSVMYATATKQAKGE